MNNSTETPQNSRPPIGDKQKRVLDILVKHFYPIKSIAFIQKKGEHGPLYVRRVRWTEISLDVITEVKKLFPNAFMDFNDDKDFGTRNYLILQS